MEHIYGSNIKKILRGHIYIKNIYIEKIYIKRKDTYKKDIKET